MPEISGYHHVALTVTDIDKSAGWYTDVLGFRTFRDFERDGFRKVLVVHPQAGRRSGSPTTERGDRATPSASSARGWTIWRSRSLTGLRLMPGRRAWMSLGWTTPRSSRRLRATSSSSGIPDNVQLEVYAANTSD